MSSDKRQTSYTLEEARKIYGMDKEEELIKVIGDEIKNSILEEIDDTQ